MKERGGGDAPERPRGCLKPSTAVIGPHHPLRHPAISDRVDFEGELAVVIGSIAADLTPENAMKAVYGYTVANDVTARDLQKTDGQWSRAKGFDTFCPLGPWIETDIDPSDLAITTTLTTHGVDEIMPAGRDSPRSFQLPTDLSPLHPATTSPPGNPTSRRTRAINAMTCTNSALLVGSPLPDSARSSIRRAPSGPRRGRK